MRPSPVVVLLALVALWWPGRLAGAFDGAPFDSGMDAVVLGLLLPVLLCLIPEATRDRRVPALVVALLAWKSVSSLALAQDGFCTRVVPPGHAVAVKNWDMRTDWLSVDPQCSAIVDRALVQERQFPVWWPFSFAETGSAAINPNPHTVVTRLTMSGHVRVDTPGRLRLWTSPSVDARVTVDGRAAAGLDDSLTAGSHHIVIDATLRGENWILAPLWNERDLFQSATVLASAPSTLDDVVRPWGRLVPFAVVVALLTIATTWAGRAVGERPLLFWIAGSALAAAAMAALVPERRWHYLLTLLLAACALHVPSRLHNIRGAVVLFAPAWLSLSVVNTYIDERFGWVAAVLPGNDWWVFQRGAYLIYMNGFWLQGGEDAFWFQPFYRWIAGALHMLFGQSHVGENYWDAIGVLILALFSLEVVRRAHGFRWGSAAAALVLVTFVSGPGYVFIGRGLSEISSAAFICLAAVIVIQAREQRSRRLLLMACCLAVLGVWTRLNNLPMALAIAIFAWPLSEPAASLWKPRRWLANAWYPPLIMVPAVIAFGMGLFALRTWYYTGRFSVFYGTQSALLAVWQPGMSAWAVARGMLDSVLMVATTTDPPSYHNGALPVMAGLVLAVAALSGAGALGRLPLTLVGFTLAAFSSALIARGNAYSGRFSIHVLAVTVAVVVCAVAEIVKAANAARAIPPQRLQFKPRPVGYERPRPPV